MDTKQKAELVQLETKARARKELTVEEYTRLQFLRDVDKKEQGRAL